MNSKSICLGQTKKWTLFGACPLKCACYHVHCRYVYIVQNRGFCIFKMHGVLAIFLLELELKNSAIFCRGESQLSKAVCNFSVRQKLWELGRFKVLKIFSENRWFSQIGLALNALSSSMGGTYTRRLLASFIAFFPVLENMLILGITLKLTILEGASPLHIRAIQLTSKCLGI